MFSKLTVRIDRIMWNIFSWTNIAVSPCVYSLKFEILKLLLFLRCVSLRSNISMLCLVMNRIS